MVKYFTKNVDWKSRYTSVRARRTARLRSVLTGCRQATMNSLKVISWSRFESEALSRCVAWCLMSPMRTQATGGPLCGRSGQRDGGACFLGTKTSRYMWFSVIFGWSNTSRKTLIGKVGTPQCGRGGQRGCGAS